MAAFGIVDSFAGQFGEVTIVLRKALFHERRIDWSSSHGMASYLCTGRFPCTPCTRTCK